MYQTTCSHSTNHLLCHSTKGHHDTLYGATMLPLNSQLLAIFLPFATKQATMLHYPEFTDRYSAQYGMLLFSLHFMTNIFVFHIPPPPPISPLPLRFSVTHPVHYLHTCCLVGPGLQGFLDFKCSQKQIERYLESEWQQLSGRLHSSIPS